MTRTMMLPIAGSNRAPTLEATAQYSASHSSATDSRAAAARVEVSG
ncbi:hypothetical protein [Natronolimnohabitans innermongolicus]|nr:hypothetical protein [Natronolimnohabitans innermongolicus]